jgi:metallo-beta-lactamase family protein
MCESGRILHHLIHNVGDEKNSLLIVGFMAQNTLGRRLLEMAEGPRDDPQKMIKVYDGWYKVRARIHKLNAYSAHADRNDLLAYIRGCGKLRNLVLVHGEEAQTASLAEAARETVSARIILPKFDEEIEL